MNLPWKESLASSALVLVCLVAVTSRSSAQPVVRLYPGAAPGSETWSLPEQGISLPFPGGPWISNISEPTLTAFRPNPAMANGTAIIIAPGGAFHFLSIENEGTKVAEWLRGRGITAFVLKYRVLQTTAEHIKALPSESMKQMTAEQPTVFPLAIADGRAALAYVRDHAAEFRILPGRVGMIGFSAGAMIALSLSVTEPKGAGPDFVASIYGSIADFMRPFVVPATAPPLFLVVATDDQFGFAPLNTEAYNSWISAHRSAELHVYAEGGHGFGMLRRGLPVDSWTDRFEDWLAFQGLVKRPAAIDEPR
jgi:acetyl esterase/lipase